ncbi:hypothetical protein ACQEV4_42760 [Streptomyces shenzhenensis]|uniref:hypothetical protein n=1 Tax=Streptomyces shenzhenensis TaxID=943815 RepID=UPI003D92B803
MPSLPPPDWAELFYNGTWNDITGDLRAPEPVTITRGLTAESASAAEPTACECALNSRDNRYAPRNPMSPLYGLIGRNTPFRYGYTVGSPWAEMGGVAGNLLATPTSTSFNVTDLDLRVDLALNDWTRQQGLAARYVASGDNRSWSLSLAGTGQIAFAWSATGSSTVITQFSTIPLIAYHGQRLAIRITLDVDNGAGGYELRFYTGRTVDDDEWNLLGAPIVGSSTTAVFAASAQIEVGDVVGLVNPGVDGRVHALKLLNGIGGTVACNMTTKDASPGASSFTSNGNVWTVSGGTVLTNRHVRMTGEVPAWPPTRDLSGNDNYVSINPTGLMRRMDAGTKPQDSALLRFIKTRGPVECWPLTDGPASTGARSMVGGSDMRQEIYIGEGNTAAAWGQGSLADWIEPTLQVKANTSGYIRGACRRTTGTDAFWSVDLFLAGGGIPSAGSFTVFDRGASTDEDNQVRIETVFTGNLDRLSVIRWSEGGSASSGALLANIDGVGIYNEDPHHIRLSIDPQASQTLWYLYVDGTLRGNGTIPGIVMKSVKDIRLGWGFLTLDGITMSDRSFGYLTYWDGAGPTAAEMWTAYLGYQSERAGTRIERLAAESGYTASTAGETVYQRRMGIQGRKKLLELLNEANRTNFGYLLEARDRPELIHRGQSTLWNQQPALVLDFAAGLISPPFKPVDDDKLTENDVSVKREFGSSPGRQVLDEGELSVRDFPDGVGRYDNEYTYSLATDDQADQVAYMRLHLGTYAGVRYTRITLNLANERVFALIDDILRVDVGDRLRLTSLPPDHGPDDVYVLVAGYTEEAGPDAWKITFNCVPGEPWTAGVVGSDSYGRADTGGCRLAAAVDAAGTAVDVFTTGLARWVNAAPVLNANGSFDAGIAGWAPFGGATIAWDSERGHRAPGCIAVTTTGAATPRAEGPRTAVSPGGQYVLSGWLYTDVQLGVTSSVSVNWYTAVSGGTYLSTTNINLASLTPGAWTPLQATVTAPAGALGAGVLTSLTGTPAAGLVWRADDLELRDAVPDSYPADLPFDVRTGGEVMRVTAAAPAVWDPFTRTVTGGWGTALIGGAWATSGGAATDFAVTGSAGTHTLASRNVSRYSLLPAVSGPDVDLVVDVATSALAAGASQYLGPLARALDVNNLYQARVNFTAGQAVQITLQKRVGGTQTDLASATAVGISHVASSFYTCRFQVQGSTLRAKVWPAGTPEPVAWLVTATDTALTAAGAVGVRSVLDNSNTNTLPVTASFDNFTVLNPQTFTVTRSINGVHKPQASGEDIRLANPVYVAM